VTIIEAIKEVMRAKGEPMTAKQAYEAIVSRGLYEFHAQNPAHVVLMQIRRHSEGIDFPTAAPTKHFQLVGENKFQPLEKPKRQPRRPRGARATDQKGTAKSRSLSASLRQLQDLHEEYVGQLKDRVILELRRLSPASFETFAKELLEVYGFEDTHVTSISGDGGIDGHGMASPRFPGHFR
jgi:restriction system protein